MSHLELLDNTPNNKRADLIRSYERVISCSLYDHNIHQKSLYNLQIINQLCLTPDEYDVSMSTKIRMSLCISLLYDILNCPDPYIQWEQSKQFYKEFVKVIDEILIISDLEDSFGGFSF